jgi:hypothetical protein
MEEDDDDDDDDDDKIFCLFLHYEVKGGLKNTLTE